MDTKNLLAFLARARERCSYEAEGDFPKTTLEDGTRVIGPYTEGPLSYTDRYRGLHTFKGAEEITENSQAIWRREYEGGILLPENTLKPGFAEELYATLRVFLRLFPRDRPFRRGPDHFWTGEYNYFGHCTGDMRSFHGAEEILHRGNRVYALTYRGRLEQQHRSTGATDTGADKGV